MSNFWLSKTKAEIAAIPNAQCSNGSKIWCIDTQTFFRFFKFRSFYEISWYPSVFIRPTDLASNGSGVWQNEGNIYQNRNIANGSHILYDLPPFPPAKLNQKVILLDFIFKFLLILYLFFYCFYAKFFVIWIRGYVDAFLANTPYS